MEFTSVAAPIEQRILDEFLEEMGEFDRLLAKTTPKEQQRRLKPKVLPAEKPRWNRRKEEIERLRAEVQVMEAQAAFMRLQAVHAKLYDQCASKGQRLWKAAALKERRRRQAAQRENSELKAKIMCCASTCESMKTTLKTMHTKNIECTGNGPIAAKPLRVGMWEVQTFQVVNTAALDFLEHRINTRLHEWGTVLQETQISMTDTDTDQVHVRRRDNGKLDDIIELKRTRLIPFSAEQTSRVAWDIMQLGVIPNERCTRVIRNSDDTLASQGFCSHSLTCGGNMDVRVYCVMQRVGVPGGFAVIVESITEWLAYPASSTPWTYVTQDSGCAVVRPHETQSASTNLCQVQTMVRLRTADVEEKALLCHQLKTRSPLTSTASDIVIPSFRGMMSSRHQVLDNALLDSSRTESLVN